LQRGSAGWSSQIPLAWQRLLPNAGFLDKDRGAVHNKCMMSSIWLLLATGAAMGLAALGAFLWAIKNGIFENSEDVKYTVFRDEDDD